MTYGIEIRNQEDIIILDNTPYHTLVVIASGWLPNGTNLSGVNSYPNSQVFIRPHTNGQWLRFTPIGGRVVACTDGIDYIRVRTVKEETASGYGLAIYDNQGATNLVFSDNKQFATYRKSVTFPVQLAETYTHYTLPATYPGRKKYINLDALDSIYNSSVATWQNYYYFNVNETQLVAYSYVEQSGSACYYSRIVNLNIIEA